MLLATTAAAGLRVRASVLRKKLKGIWDGKSLLEPSAQTSSAANAAHFGTDRSGMHMHFVYSIVLLSLEEPMMMKSAVATTRAVELLTKRLKVPTSNKAAISTQQALEAMHFASFLTYIGVKRLRDLPHSQVATLVQSKHGEELIETGRDAACDGGGCAQEEAVDGEATERQFS